MSCLRFAKACSGRLVVAAHNHELADADAIFKIDVADMAAVSRIGRRCRRGFIVGDTMPHNGQPRAYGAPFNVTRSRRPAQPHPSVGFRQTHSQRLL